MATVETHAKMMDEILEEANKSSDPSGTLSKYLNRPFFRDYLTAAVDDKFLSFDVDDVKYTQYDYHRSQAGAQMMNRHVFNVFNLLFSDTVTTISKKKQLKALFELLYKGEAEALYLILTKNIVSVYPNLNIEVIDKALDRLQGETE